MIVTKTFRVQGVTCCMIKSSSTRCYLSFMFRSSLELIEFGPGRMLCSSSLKNGGRGLQVGLNNHASESCTSYPLIIVWLWIGQCRSQQLWAVLCFAARAQSFFPFRCKTAFTPCLHPRLQRQLSVQDLQAVNNSGCKLKGLNTDHVENIKLSFDFETRSNHSPNANSDGKGHSSSSPI